MNNKIPSTTDVRELLQGIKQPDIELMSKQCGVPVATIIKIRHGVTANPGLETVRLLYDSPVMRSKLAAIKESIKGKPAVDSIATEKTEG